MKKRFLTLAMVGVMATAVMAPAAMAADNGNATVTYVYGAGTPDGSDGSYFVVFPADLTFFESTDQPTHTVELKATSGEVADLNSNLSVNVNVSGTGLLSAEGYDDITYQIAYEGGKTFTQANASVDLTLTPNNATQTGTGSITGTIPNVAKGTAFTDTLTFTLTENQS